MRPGDFATGVQPVEARDARFRLRPPGRRTRRALAVTTGLLLLLSCRAPDGGRPSGLPAGFLGERMGEILQDVEEARATLDADPAASSDRLEDAALGLRRLREYYLPLLAAHDQLARARDVAAASPGRASSHLDSAEVLLGGIGRAHGPHLQNEMQEPVARIEAARSALGAGDVEEARETLARLVHHLESIFYRGDLVLEGSELDPSAGPDRR